MRNRQGITIAALIIAIIGLSVGFAAFSNTLTIRSTATVTPNASTMRVVFSKSASSEVAGNQYSVAPDSETYGDGGTIDNSTQGNSILKDLHAKFTAPGQTVKYNTLANVRGLYVYNAGSLDAQLTGVTFNNVASYSSYKKCTAVDKVNDAEEATDSLVQQACNGITISVKVGNIKATPTNTTLNNQVLTTGSSLPVEVTISYEAGSAYADGEFEVTFGDIVINATSAVDTSLVPTNPWKLKGLTTSAVTFGQVYSLNNGESGLCLGEFTFISNGSLDDGEDVTTNDDFVDMGSALKVEQDYVLIDSDDYYLLFYFPTSGSAIAYISSPTSSFDMAAVVNNNEKITCHYTVSAGE